MDPDLLQIYRERNGAPGLWAEPLNALTNGVFVLAAVFALRLAVRLRAVTPITWGLVSLAAVVGVGSFLFHTCCTRLTMWLDILPIAALQVLIFWVVCRRMLGWSNPISVAVIVMIVGGAFALLPIKEPLNGSLFYAPLLTGLAVLGTLWSWRAAREPNLLLWATGCFILAVTARTVDWLVPWPLGTHFLWHLFNGAVVYLALRAWIVHSAGERVAPRSAT